MIFPPREQFYERLFFGEEGMAVRFHDEGGETHPGMVQNQERGKRGRIAKTAGADQADANRHGLFNLS